MKILNLLNGPDGWQTGIEDGFKKLKRKGQISDVNFFYYMPYIDKYGIQQTLIDIKACARSFNPDVIVLYHVGGYSIPKEFYRELKNMESKPVLIYDEHDGYERFRKPLQRSIKIAMSEAHLISLCGLGAMVNMVPRNCHQKIVYTPHQISIQRFDKEWIPTTTRKYDVIMIGNRIKSRIPFKTLSGAREREELVKALGECFGEKFAIYGKGWDGYVGNKGPLHFQKQIDAIRESWISVGIDHCVKMSYYFSSRLPISLFSGVAHVCHYHSGYEHLFEQGKDLVWFNRSDEAIDIIRVMLSRGPEYLIELGINGRRKAIESYLPEVVWGNLVTIVKQQRKCRRK